MLLAREFVGYVSRQLVNRLTPTTFEVSNPAVAAAALGQIIEEDLSVEDKLNDEARAMLEQYSDYMRQENISYQDMFRKIKRQLLVRDKIMPAAGRDSGDSSMKLSRDKVNDLAHKMVTAMRKSREFRVRKDPNDLRLAIVREMTELLQLEDKIDRVARQKIRAQKRDIAEGGEEYDLLHKRYYAEELKKLGISLNA
jgi:hypothetical protein